MAAPNLSTVEGSVGETAFGAAATLVGRLLLSAIFILSGVQKIVDWQGTAESMRNEGMVAVPVFLTLAIIFELGGGLLLLIGFYARLGALMLIVFLLVTTIIFHDFWAYEAQEKQMQMIHFMKNTTILGGLCFALVHGPGGWSIDRLRSRRRPGQF